MATYSYIARDAAGQKQEGVVEGANEQAAMTDLAARGLTPVRLTERAARRARGRGVTTRQLAGAYRQLSDLLHAGVPLLRALRLLSRGRANPRLARIMGEVADAVADGDRLADALARHERVFPAIQAAMIRAGERGGFLEDVLRRLADYLEHQADLRSKVVGQSIYPVMLLVAALGLTVAALMFFVPKFESYFKGIELPWATRLLMGASTTLVHGWMWILAGLALVGGAGWWALRRPQVRRRLAEWQLRLPVVGGIVRNLAVARFARMLGTLLHNGIAMLSAMRIGRDAAGNPVLIEAIDRATEAIKSGGSLAEPLGESGLLDEDTVEMISVGESANNLPEVLVNAADGLEKRVERQLTMLVRLMEPAIFLALAGVVVFLFVALVVPMMRLSVGG